jgi:hypothetical protein
VAERPYSINGGAFGRTARSWVDSLHALEGGQPAPQPTYEEVMAEQTRKALESGVQLNERPFGIHGGKFGEGSRAFADATREKVGEYGKNWQQGKDELLDLVYRVLQRYR